MGGRVVRTLLTIVVDVLVVIAIALAIRQVGVFFARIAHQAWFQAFDALASKFVIPFGIADIKTPYGGVFDIDNALSVVVYLGAEWVISGIRDRA